VGRNKSSTLILKFALEQAIRDIVENQKGLKLDGTHHLLVCSDGIYFLAKNKIQ
jgi:hypothetical protein